MLGLRILGGACAALLLYYARFFALRQEQLTFLQLTTLLCAAALVFMPARAGRALLLGAVLVGLSLFLVMDHDSPSVSDTLNRVAPTFALLAAMVLRLRHEDQTRRSASAPNVGTSN